MPITVKCDECGTEMVVEDAVPRRKVVRIIILAFAPLVLTTLFVSLAQLGGVRAALIGVPLMALPVAGFLLLIHRAD